MAVKTCCKLLDLAVSFFLLSLTTTTTSMTFHPSWTSRSIITWLQSRYNLSGTPGNLSGTPGNLSGTVSPVNVSETSVNQPGTPVNQSQTSSQVVWSEAVSQLLSNGSDTLLNYTVVDRGDGSFYQEWRDEITSSSLGGSHAKIQLPKLNASFCAEDVSGLISNNQRTVDVFTGCRDSVVSVNFVNTSSSSSSQMMLTVLMIITDDDSSPLTLVVKGDDLTVRQTSPFSGSIQRTDMAGSPFTDSLPERWVRLHVPADHDVMLSVALPRMQPNVSGTWRGCGSQDFVDIYVVDAHTLGSSSNNADNSSSGSSGSSGSGSGSSSNATAQKLNMTVTCADLYPLPARLTAAAVSFHFPEVPTEKPGGQSVLAWQHEARFQYSFHPHGSLPHLRVLGNGKWNCSGPGFPAVRHHFACNLQAECSEGEDERDCPYSSARCGPGNIDIMDNSSMSACYVYQGAMTDASPPQTWSDANDYCHFRGGHLASLNTEQEWQLITELLTDFPLQYSTFLGLNKASVNDLPYMYRNLLMWTDGTVAHYVALKSSVPSSSEVMQQMIGTRFHRHVNPGSPMALRPVTDASAVSAFLCEVPNAHRPQVVANSLLSSKSGGPMPTVVNMTTCHGEYFVPKAFACDPASRCWDPASPQCQSQGMELFQCEIGGGAVSYSVVCDHKANCADHSDERFCDFPACQPAEHFICADKVQCIPKYQKCDGQQDCVDGSDETRCTLPADVIYNVTTGPGIMKLLDMRGHGYLAYSDWETDTCPNTHFTCPGDKYLCLPGYLLCNGVPDCPDQSDEAVCEDYTCKNLYRCRGSTVCLHPDHVCDGSYQCPGRDDELFCDVGSQCPAQCTCNGFSVVCHTKVKAIHPGTRYLHAAGSAMNPTEVANLGLELLIYLSLAHNSLTQLRFPEAFPNLRTLDLSHNLLTIVYQQDFSHLANLRSLYLVSNPLVSFGVNFSVPWVHKPLVNLKLVNMSHIPLQHLPDDVFQKLGFPNVETLSLAGSHVKSVGTAFQSLKSLKTLDLKFCFLDRFPPTVFQGLKALEYVYSENYRLCCHQTLQREIVQCWAPMDEISSCQSLLGSNMYRFFLFLFAIMALAGNTGSLMYRYCAAHRQRDLGQTCAALVPHLCVSDLLMGIYLLVVGVADRVYGANFVFEDLQWQHSGACKAAGFLCLLSSEVSCFVICLLTLDKLLALCFPLSKIRFSHRTAHLACCGAWLVGLILAAIPLFPPLRHWQFYSHTPICIPLPVSRVAFPGHPYSFAIFVILNFVLFLFVAGGQIMIGRAVRLYQMNSSNEDHRISQELQLSVSQRLFTIALTDFLCWFPIGVLGFLSSAGTRISNEVLVSLAIFVLPINSALNPFIYTLNLRQRGRRRPKLIYAPRNVAMSPTRRAVEARNSNGSVSENSENVTHIEDVSVTLPTIYVTDHTSPPPSLSSGMSTLNVAIPTIEEEP